MAGNAFTFSKSFFWSPLSSSFKRSTCYFEDFELVFDFLEVWKVQVMGIEEKLYFKNQAKLNSITPRCSQMHDKLFPFLLKFL